jgi:hypothetical protein
MAACPGFTRVGKSRRRNAVYKKKEKSLEEESGHGRQIPPKALTRNSLCPDLELF